MTSDPDSAQKEWLAGVFDRAAPSYDRIGDAYHDHFGARLAETAGIHPGARVLDVACGRGAVLLPAAARAGAERPCRRCGSVARDDPDGWRGPGPR